MNQKQAKAGWIASFFVAYVILNLLLFIESMWLNVGLVVTLIAFFMFGAKWIAPEKPIPGRRFLCRSEE